jgi:hypothetical protein
MSFKNVTTIRYVTFIAGMALAALMTAQLLSTSTSSAEFWIELKTGTGWSFFAYTLPYVVYLYFSGRLSRAQQASVVSVLIVAIGIVMNVGLFYTNKHIKPADVAIIDPSIYFVLAQIALAVALPTFLSRK